MKFVPNSITRLGARSALKVSKNSPTILVVAGVVGLGATAVLAAKSSRKADAVIQEHKSVREAIGEVPSKEVAGKEERKAAQVRVLELYYHTGFELTKVYGPAIALGVVSAGSVLWGHKILKGRHVATLAAYSGLSEQFAAYRGRVAKTLGEKAERDIYDGAFGEYVEDPDHKGEYKLQPNWSESDEEKLRYCRPWFDEVNVHWSRDPEINYFFLKGVQSHMNDLLNIRGHLFLNEVLDALHMDRSKEASVMGWVRDNPDGDSFVDFGFMTGDDPQTVAFRNKMEARVRLNFNVDREPIWNLI
jgi:hypothetical protein